MEAEAVTYALLSGAGPVTTVVGTRIFPTVLPIRQPSPAIVYELVSAVRVPAIDAYAATHLMRSRVQVNLISKDYGVTRTLRAAVLAAMQFQRGAIAGTTVHSVTHAGEGPVSHDQELDLYSRPLDFLITHESL
jgi:hypothetical protein